MYNILSCIYLYGNDCDIENEVCRIYVSITGVLKINSFTLWYMGENPLQCFSILLNNALLNWFKYLAHYAVYTIQIYSSYARLCKRIWIFFWLYMMIFETGFSNISLFLTWFSYRVNVPKINTLREFLLKLFFYQWHNNSFFTA